MTTVLRTILAGVLLPGAGFIQTAVLAQSLSPPQTSPSQYRAVLNRYCVVCHNEKLKTAGLMLDHVDVESPSEGAEVWEKVIRKLRGNAMPPPHMPRPDQSFYNDFPVYLETAIDRAALAKPNPGRPTAHRLNRAEYVNAIRDLLSLDIDGDSLLPVDDSGYGFDNIGDVLSISPALLERYLSAARKISRVAVGDSAMRPTEETYEVHSDVAQGDRMSEELPLGSRGGMAVHHNFPADGEYVIKVRLKKQNTGGDGALIRGVALKRQIDFRLDDSRLKLFTVGGERFGGKGMVVGLGVQALDVGNPEQEEYERHGADAGLEVRIPVKAGPHVVGVAFLVADASRPESTIVGERFDKSVLKFGVAQRVSGKNDEPWVDTVTISGPYDAKGLGQSPSRQKIFVCHPAGSELGGNAVEQGSLKAGTDEESCARRILTTLAHRAYRRPLTDAEVKVLLSFYNAGRSKGGFEEGIRMALERILDSLQFLFRIERDPVNAEPGAVFRISDLELASRLSFFLWSTLPDDELLNLAERGNLKDPAVLEQQVRRMLRDPRSSALVSNFFGQWLQLRHVAELAPDVVEFPEFDVNLRTAFQQETELFLQSMLREDRPLMELLDADYTFLNERLARHYGIPDVYGSTFRRVTLTDENRRGVLGQGSILSLTSYATRTSVVLRGVWLLTNILATPPPPPPPNVPALKDRADDGTIKSVRQSMEAHRANPVCASCHLRMDPLGFALENFDAVGQWRTTEGAANTPIDSTGTLPDGTKLEGAAGLRKMLLSKPDQFASTVTEKLLTYAVGRGVEYFDEPAIRKIRREAAPDYRWSSLILGIVKSEPFQWRTREQ